MLPGSGSEKWETVSFPILHTRLTKRLLTENPVTCEEEFRTAANMDQVIAVLNRAANSNAVIHTMLASVFGALTARSFMQGREIEALQAEKDSLLKENKGIKRTIWDWKQTLYAEAEANPHEALVSLATLKSIYGDVVTSKALVASGSDSQDGKSPPAEIIV